VGKGLPTPTPGSPPQSMSFNWGQSSEAEERDEEVEG